MKKLKNKKGITLVALVITIVVLLILAVILINSINDNGIIGKAKEAKQNYTNSAEKEQEEITRQIGLIEDAIGVEKVPTGTAIDTSSGRAIVLDDVLYIATDTTNQKATVYAYRGEGADYTNMLNWQLSNGITSGDVVIYPKVQIDGEEYEVSVVADLWARTITSVVIPSSVTNIWDNSLLTTVTKITIKKESGSITGSPWGAMNAVVEWVGND